MTNMAAASRIGPASCSRFSTRRGRRCPSIVGFRLNPMMNRFHGLMVDAGTLPAFEHVVRRANAYGLAHLNFTEPHLPDQLAGGVGRDRGGGPPFFAPGDAAGPNGGIDRARRGPHLRNAFAMRWLSAGVHPSSTCHQRWPALRRCSGNPDPSSGRRGGLHRPSAAGLSRSSRCRKIKPGGPRDIGAARRLYAAVRKRWRHRLFAIDDGTGSRRNNNQTDGDIMNRTFANASALWSLFGAGWRPRTCRTHAALYLGDSPPTPATMRWRSTPWARAVFSGDAGTPTPLSLPDIILTYPAPDRYSMGRYGRITSANVPGASACLHPCLGELTMPMAPGP